MARLKRFSLWASILLACTLGPMVLSAYWLLGTNSGAHWTLQFSQKYLPVSIQYQALNGSLWGGIDSQKLQVNAKHSNLGFHSIVIESLQLNWHPITVLNGELMVPALTISGTKIFLEEPQGSTTPPPSLPQFFLPLAVNIKSLNIIDTTVVTFDNHESQLPNLRTQLTLGANTVELHNFAVDLKNIVYSGNIQLQFSQRLRYELHLITHGAVNLIGECEVNGVLVCHADLDWQSFSHPLLTEAQFPEGKVTLSLHDTLAKIDGSAQIETPYIETEIETEIEVDLSSQSLQLNRFSAPAFDGEVNISGNLSWEKGISLNTQLQLQSLSLKQWLPPELADSELSLNTQISFQKTTTTTHLESTLILESLSLGGRPIKGQCIAQLHNQQLTISELSLQAAHATVSANGRYQFDSQNITAQLHVNADDLQQIVPHFGGTINAALNAQGSLLSPQLDFSLQGSKLTLPPVSIEKLNGSFRISSTVRSDLKHHRSLPESLNALNVQQFSVQAQQLQWQQQHVGDIDVNFTGNAADHTLALTVKNLFNKVNISPLQLTGNLSMPTATNADPSITDWQNTQWQGSLKQFELRTTETTDNPVVLSAPADIELSVPNSTITTLCLTQNTLKACIEKAELKNLQNFMLNAELAGVYFDRQRTIFPDYYQKLPENLHIDGEFKTTVQAQGKWDTDNNNLQQLTLFARAEVVGGNIRYTLPADPNQAEDTLNSEYPIEQLWLQVDGDEQALTISGLGVLGTSEKITVNGHIAGWQRPEPTLDFRMKGKLDNLNHFQPLTPSLRDLRGKANVDLQYRQNGSTKTASVLGLVDIEEFGFLLPQTGTHIDNWKFKLNASPASIDLSGEGLVGKGFAEISGALRATDPSKASGAPFTALLAIKGNNLDLVELPDARFMASPNLQLAGTGLNWHLNGNLTVENSFYILRELPATAISISEDARIYGEDTIDRKPLLRFTSDVHLSAEKNNRFEGFGLKTDVAGRLHFTRDEKNVDQLQGVLSLPEGEFKAYGQNLEIDNGQITFSGPIGNPAMDVRASRRIDNVTAGIWLHGTAKKPKSTLYSSPNMSESDILAYMLTGKPLGQATGGSASNMEAAALALGLRQALPALQKFGNQFGINDITVESGPAGGGGSVAAGKRLNDKLYVKYQYGLVGAVGGFVVEYSLTDRLKLEAGSGETDTVDLTYTWDSTPPNTLSPSATIKQKELQQENNNTNKEAQP